MLRNLVLSALVLSSAAVPVQHGVKERLFANASTPVVLWHGMGDNCCLPFSMGEVQKMIHRSVGPSVYVRSLMIGTSPSDDQYNGFFMPIQQQIDLACEIVSLDPLLKGGFHAVGFSQGGLFLRVLAERCPTARILNLVSVGGPQQGVFGLPHCTKGGNSTFCAEMRALLELGAYNPIVQGRLVQAQYWQDPVRPEEFLKRNIFLPAANNAIEPKDPSIPARLAALTGFVMVKFLQDTMVIPRESEWFEFYAAGQDKIITPLSESALYKEDWLGLRALDAQGKLHRLECPGDHLEMPPGYFESKIVPFLM